jgi:hypothetical protein
MPKAALIARVYSIISSSSILQAELGLAGQLGCKQRVEAPDDWEVTFQVNMCVMAVHHPISIIIIRIIIFC